MNIGNITSDNFNLDGNGKDIQIEVYEQLIEKLQKENKILRENAEHNDKVVDKVNWENKELKKQLEEYRKTNEHLLDKKQFLKQENQLLKKQLEEINNFIKKKFVAQGGFTSYEWNDLLNKLLDKMQEMEKNYGNVEDNT